MKNFSLFIVLVILIGCNSQPVAYFQEPQPSGSKVLNSFPQALQGLYTDREQTSFLEIEPLRLTRYYAFDLKLHQDSLGEDMVLKGDTLIDITTGDAFNITRRGDSVFHHYRSETDTLFTIEDENVVKKFKGHYFLNTAEDNGGWSVQRLTLRRGILSIGAITDSTDLQKLETIAGNSVDTTTHHFTPTRRQFRRFVREEGFSETDSFYRISRMR